MSKQSDYLKQWRRINRRIKALIERGYTIDYRSLPSFTEKPTLRHINKLKSITPQYLYQHSWYELNPNEFISGLEARHRERSIAAKKAAETRRRYHEQRKNKAYNTPEEAIDENTIIIDNFYDLLGKIDDATVQHMNEIMTRYAHPNEWDEWMTNRMTTNDSVVNRLFDATIKRLGVDGFLSLVNANADAILALLNTIYDSKNQYKDAADAYLSELAAILNGGVLSMNEAKQYEIPLYSISDGEDDELY